MTQPRPRRADQTDAHVGNRIRTRRKMVGLSQQKLADGMKVSYQMIQKYEQGNTRVSAGRLQQIATILQVPISFFYEGLPSTPAADLTLTDRANIEAYRAFTSSTDGDTIIKAFARIQDPNVRRRVANLVEAIAA